MREGKFYEPGLEYDDERKLHVYKPPFEIPWPTVGIDSFGFGKLPIHERFRQLAHGYLASSKSLTVELGENPDRLNWPRAAAAWFCYYHTVELFVKACILFRSPADKLNHHDVAELKSRYHQLYPSDKYFAFQCIWDIRLKDVERAFGAELSGYYFDGKQDQFFRYLADKEGNPPKSIHYFWAGTVLKAIEHFEEDMNRIWENILESSAK